MASSQFLKLGVAVSFVTLVSGFVAWRSGGFSDDRSVPAGFIEQREATKISAGKSKDTKTRKNLNPVPDNSKKGKIVYDSIKAKQEEAIFSKRSHNLWIMASSKSTVIMEPSLSSLEPSLFSPEKFILNIK
ncbi:MAG TPA: hypothetical protein VI731_06880 [Bacteroidia bacterium]|nr:hypothetical protein [Bacteroidia bacterium]